MREHARDAGAGDLRRGGCHGHARRDAVEDEDRCREKAATDTDHAGQQADEAAQADDHQRVDGQAGDGKVDIHERRETSR